jgi:hypothetical protein
MIKVFDKFRFYNKGVKAAYSAVVLEPEYSNLLLSTFIYPNEDFSNWVKFADHMTICLGELPEHLKRYWLGEEVSLTVTELGISDKAIAVKVDGFFSISKPKDEEYEGSKFPHITLAINNMDAKPSDSNHIINWKPVDKIKLVGVIKEISF